jgi:hypothetical protein
MARWHLNTSFALPVQAHADAFTAWEAIAKPAYKQQQRTIEQAHASGVESARQRERERRAAHFRSVVWTLDQQLPMTAYESLGGLLQSVGAPGDFEHHWSDNAGARRHWPVWRAGIWGSGKRSLPSVCLLSPSTLLLSGWEIATAIDGALLEELVSALHDAAFFAISADSSTDNASVDQLSLDVYLWRKSRRVAFFGMLVSAGTDSSFMLGLRQS